MSTTDNLYKRQRLNTDVETMLGCVDGNSLRNVYRNVTNSKTISQEMNKTEKILSFLKSPEVDQDELLSELYEAEANRPFSYIFIAYWDGDFDSLKSLEGAAYEINNNDHFSELKCTHVGTGENYIRYTFEHDIESTRWYSKDGGRFPDDITVRHPYIVTYYKRGFVFVSYPGVSKSRNKKAPLIYTDVVANIDEIIGDEFGITLRTLSVRKVVDSFLKNKSNLVSFLKINSRNLQGGMEFASSSGEEFSAEMILPALMKEHLPEIELKDIEKAFVEAIRKCEQSSSILFWKKEGIATSLSYIEIGTEVNFIWYKTKPTYDAAIRVLKLLILLSERLGRENKSLSKLFFEADQFRIFTYSEILSSVQMNEEEVKKELSTLIGYGVVEMLYRLNTDQRPINYPEFSEWTTDLMLLRDEFELENGEVFDGKSPKNIEVAYRLAVKGEDELS